MYLRITPRGQCSVTKNPGGGDAVCSECGNVILRVEIDKEVSRNPVVTCCHCLALPRVLWSAGKDGGASVLGHCVNECMTIARADHTLFSRKTAQLTQREHTCSYLEATIAHHHRTAPSVNRKCPQTCQVGESRAACLMSHY